MVIKKLNQTQFNRSDHPDHPDHPNRATTHPESLLKHLIQAAAQAPSLKVLESREDALHEVIAESEMNGTQYYLVRCAAKIDRPLNLSPLNLSPREQEIAYLVAQGFPSKCIGASLKISHWTVNTHLRRIFYKLGVTSRAAMVARLVQENLLG